MIKYALKCEAGHRFDGWFRSSAAFDEQRDAGDLVCPVCGTSEVDKALMAPTVRSSDRQAAKPVGQESMPAELREKVAEFLSTVRDHVEKNCDYVGDDFAEEARRIHYGESDPRSIYGEATPEEANELFDEGVEVAPLPILPRARQQG